MGYDAKYGKITTERESIPADEPVFMIRARDATAMYVLGTYLDNCTKIGSPLEHLHMVLDTVEEFRNWRAEHPELIKIPDSKRHGGMADV